MVCLTAVAVGLAGLVLAPTDAARPAAAGPPQSTVDQAADLVDGQQVTVTGTGFALGAQVATTSAGARPSGPVDCDLGTVRTAGSTTPEGST